MEFIGCLKKALNKIVILSLFIGHLLYSGYSEKVFACSCETLFNLSKANSLNEQKEIRNKINQLMNDLVQLKDVVNQMEEMDSSKLLFTNASNRYYLPFCGMRTLSHNCRIDRAGLYPNGLVVKPIVRVNLDRKYVYGIAEYGMKILIKEDDLTPIEEDKIYLFSQSTKPVPYCIQDPKCIDNLLEEGTTLNKRVLNSHDRYAVVKNYTADQLEEIENCSQILPLELELYNRGHKPLHEQKRYTTNCLGKDLKFGSLKIVTLAKYEQRFKNSFKGVYLRVDSNLIDKLNQVLNTSLVKQCEPKDYRIPLATNISDPIKSNFKNILSRIYKKSDRYATFFDYTFDEANSPLTLQCDKRVYTVAACDEDGYPKEAKYILVFNEQFDKYYIRIDATSIIQSLKDNFKLEGYKPETTGDNLEEGKFWEITGPDQYYSWKATLEHEILSSAKIAILPQDQQLRIAKFIAELILSSAFVYPGITE